MKKLFIILMLLIKMKSNAQLGYSSTGVHFIGLSSTGIDSVAVDEHIGGACSLINFCLPVILPVHILQLEGERLSANQVRLSWLSSNEGDNLGFELQRSDDHSSAFQKISFVSAIAGSLPLQNYLHYDPNSYGGASYYRVKQIDNDGKFRYSNTIKIEGLSKKLTASVFPNPIISTATLSIAIPPTHIQGTIEVMDMTGKRLYKELKPAGYYRSFEIDWFRKMASGVYYIRISDNYESITIKVVVTH